MVLSCNMFCQGLSDAVFFFCRIIKKLQHSQSSEMLSFLHHFFIVELCEVDADVKLEN